MTTPTELIIFQPVSQKKRIAIIPGDGIGPEVIAAGRESHPGLAAPPSR